MLKSKVAVFSSMVTDISRKESILDEETRDEIRQLTSTEYLDRLLGDIVKRKLDKDRGRVEAFKHGESPRSGGELADFMDAFQNIDISDRTLLLHYITKLMSESIVELIAENNRRLLRLLSK